MDAKEDGSGASGTRDKLVEQAVRFLQNPKVKAAPEQSKRDFLKSKGLSDEEIDKAMQRAAQQIEASTAPVLKYEQQTNKHGGQETHSVTFSNTVLSIYTSPCTAGADVGAAVVDAMQAALDRCGRDSVIEVQIQYPASDRLTDEALGNVRHRINEALQQRYGTSAPIHLLLPVSACSQVTVRVLSVRK